MLEYIKNCFIWLLSKHDQERDITDSADKLQMSMRVTAKCRYNAATRLKKQQKFSFFTTTYLSLGLIFIPLMENSGLTLDLTTGVLNMMQTFLAVSVLVYSVIIGTSRYDYRAEQLTECGDKLKEIIRSIDKKREVKKTNCEVFNECELSDLQKRYSDIVTQTENHERSDYKLAMLEMHRDYFISGLPRFINYASANISNLLPYMIPLFMIFSETVFIVRMFRVF